MFIRAGAHAQIVSNLTKPLREEIMASQVVAGNLDVLLINSYIRGYHAYMEVWAPVLDEMLIVKREPTNVADRSAVAVYKEDLVVGHVPFNLASSISNVLKRDTNKAFAKVTGDKVNRGAGYGLEIPCVYSLYHVGYPKRKINFREIDQRLYPETQLVSSTLQLK